MTKVHNGVDPRPAITFIVPVRNDAARLKGCLERIRGNENLQHRIEVIVVDHDSVDGSDRVARSAGATVLSAAGLTVGALRNQGARAARGRVLAFVDADHEIDLGWAQCAVELLSDARTGAVGALYHAPSDGTWVQRVYDGLRAHKPGCRDVAWLGSGNLAVRADAFWLVNGFDSTLETCEDVDFCVRLRAAGFRVVSDDRLRSVHLGDPSTLRALFLGELWRGRDNLRTSLRGPLSWRDVPSVAIPVIDLAGLALVGTGVIVAPAGGLTLTGMALGIIGGLASLRAARILASRRAFGPVDILQSFIVASVYDFARALALLVRTPHETRRAACAS